MPELLVVATSAGLDARDLVRALERAAPEGTRVRSAPGLLAEGEPGEGLVAEGALERGATVLVLAPGGADLANHALLTIEVARARGLVVPAVVVAGPGGAAQRETVRAWANADVVELPDPAAPMGRVSDWPLADWLAAEPVVTTGVGVALTPYGGWEPRPTPDPRTAGREAISAALQEIVRDEGPVYASRAYGLLNKASGGKKLTSIVRAPLSSAAYRLRQAGTLVVDESHGGEEVLRLAGTPAVRVRALGPRTLDEVPLEEVAALMARLREAGADGAPAHDARGLRAAPDDQPCGGAPRAGRGARHGGLADRRAQAAAVAARDALGLDPVAVRDPQHRGRGGAGEHEHPAGDPEDDLQRRDGRAAAEEVVGEGAGEGDQEPEEQEAGAGREGLGGHGPKGSRLGVGEPSGGA